MKKPLLSTYIAILTTTLISCDNKNKSSLLSKTGLIIFENIPEKKDFVKNGIIIDVDQYQYPDQTFFNGATKANSK